MQFLKTFHLRPRVKTTLLLLSSEELNNNSLSPESQENGDNGLLLKKFIQMSNSNLPSVHMDVYGFVLFTMFVKFHHKNKLQHPLEALHEHCFQQKRCVNVKR